MKPRLAVTDNDPRMRQIYRLYFSKFGFKVATAGDGLECVRLLRTFTPHVLVLSLDLCWGGADGVLAILREESPARSIPVVLTAVERHRSRSAEFLSPPVVKMFEKPFRLSDLRAIVTAALHSATDRPICDESGVPASFTRDDVDVAPDHLWC